jgi:aminocarboxymuconate-semialdehyde decarboxylase
VLSASDFPFDAEGGAYLVRETLRSIDCLNLPGTVRSAVLAGNLQQFISAV